MKAFHASPPLTEDAAINAIAAKHATSPQVRACRKEPQASTAARPSPSASRARAPLHPDSSPLHLHSTCTPPPATAHRAQAHSSPAPAPAARGQTVLLAWAVQRPTAIIPKSVTPARIKANLDDVLALTLDADDLAAISALDKPGLEGCYCHPKTPWLGRSAFTGSTEHYYG